MFEHRNITHFSLNLDKKVKNFLLSNRSREFFLFLFFFFIASGFWLLQTLHNDYEAEFSIPIRLRGVPNNVVITSEPPAEIRVRIKDKGTILLNYMIGKSFFPIHLQYTDYVANNHHVKIYAADFEKQITNQLNASSRLLSIKPDTLEYFYSTGKSKLVPVLLAGKVTPGRQHYIVDTIYSPDSVLVFAPKTILDTITAAYTQPVELDDLMDTTVHRVPLIAIKGAKFVPNTVKLTFPVDMYTEKTVEVPLYGVNFPADKVLRTFPSRVQVTFQVGINRYRSIKAENFIIHVSYEELIKLGTDKYTVKLKAVPSGASHIRIVPQTVDFLIEQVATDGY